MTETNDPVRCFVDSVCETLRYLGNASYAILPEEVAHRAAEVEKDFWQFVKSGIDKEIEWIDECVAGGDRLREEWRRACENRKAGEETGGG